MYHLYSPLSPLDHDQAMQEWHGEDMEYLTCIMQYAVIGHERMCGTHNNPDVITHPRDDALFDCDSRTSLTMKLL